ncbi:hypothetical protein HGRIS_000332 [Hohenbuehelia grisea]|uniref:Acid phosphatase n=1 Tax=Hohenbuehelia grisea TaxID=104357 RepID=A0ABR3JQV9_9AGAR
MLSTTSFWCLFLAVCSLAVDGRVESPVNFLAAQPSPALLKKEVEAFSATTSMNLDQGPNDDKNPSWKSPEVGLDVENYPIAPDGLQLEQVHVYVRHGERSPVGVRMAEPPASIPEHWMMCKSAERFRETVSDLLNPAPGLTLPLRKNVERKDGSTASGECLLGELTDTGRQSTLNYGLGLRKLYIERLKFMPDILKNATSVYFRSTNVPRTIESLRYVMHGLYPAEKRSSDTIPTMLIRNGKDENLMPNASCKRLQELMIGFAKAAASTFNPKLEALDAKLSKYIGGNPIRLDGRPRASGIMDTVRAAMVHNISVPKEFHDPAVTGLLNGSQDVSAVPLTKAVPGVLTILDKSQEVRRLSMGRLFEDLSDKMHRKVVDGPKHPLKLLVHSTHDTAIAAIRASLDVFDDKWPAFTASITFELFSGPPKVHQKSYLQSLLASTEPPEHYVRMRSQNRNLALVACAEDGKHLPGHPEFCTFAAFHAHLRKLVPADFDRECAATSEKKAGKR